MCKRWCFEHIGLELVKCKFLVEACVCIALYDPGDQNNNNNNIRNINRDDDGNKKDDDNDSNHDKENDNDVDKDGDDINNDNDNDRKIVVIKMMTIIVMVVSLMMILMIVTHGCTILGQKYTWVTRENRGEIKNGLFSPFVYFVTSYISISIKSYIRKY